MLALLSSMPLALGDAKVHPLETVYFDMHDGDQKKVTVSPPPHAMVTIVPHGNDQKWVVKAPFNEETRTANIDFRVPGKPGPPPVNLSMTLTFEMTSTESGCISGCFPSFEFTDPSGALGL